ncbi:MAG: phosphatase PAP2 family protein [Patescibacteria group bacterium]|nr:phosphatase PAP2 family protein [Patescibacteria group bacterium]
MYVLAVRFISEYLIYILLLSLPYYLWKRNFKLVIQIVLAVVIADLIRKIAGHIWFEPRPFMANPKVLLYPAMEKDSSFFSGHAAISFALAGSIFWQKKKTGKWFILGAIVVAIGRVLPGMHYFHDVVIGAAVGLSVSYLIVRLYPRLENKFRQLQLSWS